MDSKTPKNTFKKILSFDSLNKKLDATVKTFSQNNNLVTVNVDRILYLKSDSSYTVIYLADGKKIVSSNTLKSCADKLGSDKFLRVHPSYVINKTALSCYLANQNKIVLHNSQEIPVSNSKKEGLLIYLKTLMV